MRSAGLKGQSIKLRRVPEIFELIQRVARSGARSLPTSEETQKGMFDRPNRKFFGLNPQFYSFVLYPTMPHIGVSLPVPGERERTRRRGVRAQSPVRSAGQRNIPELRS